MYNNEVDSVYFIHETKYYGLYVWAFNTDSKKEKKVYLKKMNNQMMNQLDVMGTYNGLTDND